MKYKLLVIDANPSSLVNLYDHLDRTEYDIFITGNGIDAIEQALQIQPNLILLDAQIPGMSGYETCRVIKANAAVASVPVIFLSPMIETENQLKGFAAGGIDYITKPFNALEVVARIKAHIKQSRLHQEFTIANTRIEVAINQHMVDLRKAQFDLERETERRQKSETERQRILQLMHEQNQQLHDFTEWLLQAQPMDRLELTKLIDKQLRRVAVAISAEIKLALENSPTEEMPYIQSAQVHSEQLLRFLKNVSLPKEGSSQTLTDIIPPPVAQLTIREREILAMLANGSTSIEIGNKLSISDATVRTYRTRIMRKLNIPHLPGLVKFALKYNLATFD